MIHVFSDASQCGDLFAGAYVISSHGPFGIRLESCESSTEAELRTAAYALYEARVLYADADLSLHVDLDPLLPILENNRVFGASELANAIQECNASVYSDANKFKEHRICHHYARVMAGIKGSQHPWLNNQLSINWRPILCHKIRAVLEVLSAHESGVSEMRIGQESGLGLAAAHKVLRTLKLNNVADSHRPEGIAGCDLRLVIWQRGERFEEVAEQMLAGAS